VGLDIQHGVHFTSTAIKTRSNSYVGVTHTHTQTKVQGHRKKLLLKYLATSSELYYTFIRSPDRTESFSQNDINTEYTKCVSCQVATDATVIPRLHDTAGCQTGCQPGLTTGWMFVYTIQPVIKPVWQPVWQQVVSC